MTNPTPEDQTHAGSENKGSEELVDDRVELHRQDHANRIIDEAEESADAQADADADADADATPTAADPA